MAHLPHLLSSVFTMPGSWRRRGEAPRVLAVVRTQACREALRRIFHDAGWVLDIVEDVRAATAPSGPRAGGGAYGMVLYERDGTDGHWAADVAALSRISYQPWVVLLSATNDKNLWDEMCRQGGSEILRMPLRSEEVIRTVNAGFSLWRNRQRLRPPTQQSSRRCARRRYR